MCTDGDAEGRVETGDLLHDACVARGCKSEATVSFRNVETEKPEIAKAHFDEGFLAEAYNPAVAAKCGTYG